MNINTIWNDSHPNDLKDGFGNNNIIHYNENQGGSSGGKELVNVIANSQNSIVQSVLTGVNDMVLREMSTTKETVSNALSQNVDGMLQVMSYCFQNYVNPANGNNSMTINNTYNNRIGNDVQFNPSINVGEYVNKYLTSEHHFLFYYYMYY